MEANKFERVHSVEKWYSNPSRSRSRLHTLFKSLIFKGLNILYHEQSECIAHALWFYKMRCIILQCMLTSFVCCFPFRISSKIVYTFPSHSGILHAKTASFSNWSSWWWVRITNLFDIWFYQSYRFFLFFFLQVQICPQSLLRDPKCMALI